MSGTNASSFARLHTKVMGVCRSANQAWPQHKVLLHVASTQTRVMQGRPLIMAKCVMGGEKPEPAPNNIASVVSQVAGMASDSVQLHTLPFPLQC